MTSVTIEHLKTVVALKDQPDYLLQWILEHSICFEYEDGTAIRKLVEAQDEMFFLLEGAVNFYMDVNGRQVYYFTFANDTASGGVSGLLPYSRMKTSPGYAYASGRVRALTMHKEHFPELERRSPELIQRLVGYMTERARLFATIQLQHEKVSALGKLSAGIAHELNNPASAISRIASELSKKIRLNYELTEKLLQHGIKAEDIQSINHLVVLKTGRSEKPKLTALQKIEREDALRDWVERYCASLDCDVTDTLLDADFSDEDLEKIRSHTQPGAFAQVLRWLENLLSSQRLVKDLGEASSRISNLVGAIKSHVHMDRTNELQLTNIHNDIDNTLTLLGYKLREKNISVNKSYCTDLAEMPAYVGELNQVWTNLIDNAIYAVNQNGELTIETTCNSKNVRVKVIDNGSGIPKEIMSRIFDPFFTEGKAEGTGLGLAIVSNIIQEHDGTISCLSKDDWVEFEVTVPSA